MNLEAYFKRIQYTGDTHATVDNLRKIHRAHLMHIPFENLNIHMPKPIILDESALFTKIVEENRGGFCFEQNGLFHAVLTELGYDVQRLEANVHHGDGKFGIPMDHMCLLVTIDGQRYLADVGFGASFIEPLAIDTTAIQEQSVGRFKIELEGETGYYYSQGISDDKITISYRFFFAPHALADYETACHYMQTSPQTHFTQKRVCSRWSEQGRITLSDDKFIVTSWDGQRSETPIHDEVEWHELLQEHFGITIQTQRPKAENTV